MTHVRTLGLGLLASIAACTAGTDSDVRRTLPPDLRAEPTIALEPHVVREDGRMWARAGATLSVELDIDASQGLDRTATVVSFTGIPLAPAGPGVWTRVLDGTEDDGIKSLGIVLVDEIGQQVRVEADDTDGDLGVVGFDFTPPTADCVLSPKDANGTESVTFRVLATERLGAEPVVTSNVAGLSAGTWTALGRDYSTVLTFPPDTNLASYTLDVSIQDEVGNPAGGDSLCDETDRQGSRLGRGPAVDGTVTVVGDPQVVDGDAAWVRKNATVTVTIPTTEAVDPNRSTVTLSGLVLDHVRTDASSTVWEVDLAGTEGDGAKVLRANLADAAGNPLVVEVPDAIRFDFTPPTAACSLAPPAANGDDAVVFTLTPTEPLASPPALTSSDVALDGPVADGARWTTGIDAPDNAVTDYTIAVSLTDRVGNTSSDADVCASADRTGRVDATTPTLSSAPVVTVSPSTHTDGTRPWAKAGDLVAIELDPDEDLDLDQTLVTLSGLELATTDGTTWTATLDGTEGDGLKDLRIQLVDLVGNDDVIVVEDVVRFDFTPPGATCVISPNPANALATPSLRLIPFETLGAPPSLTPSTGSVGTPSGEGTAWIAELLPPPDVDVDVTVGVSLVDLVGNTSSDAEVCAGADRTAAIRGRTPTLTAVTTLDVTPSIDDDGRPRAASGAVVTVLFDADDTLDPEASFLSMSGIPMASEDGLVWTAILDGTEGDGPKSLVGTLVDLDGNPLDVQDPTVAFVADFTAPRIANVSATRTPAFAPASGTGLLRLSATDPRTGAPVSASLRVFPDEALGDTPTLVQTEGTPEFLLGAEPGDGSTLWVLDSVPQAASGSARFTVVLEDEVGNASDAMPLGVEIVFDTEPPDVPDVETPERIVFHRAPWGASLGQSASFIVEGAAGAVGADQLVVASSSTGALLGSATADGDGAFSLPTGADAAALTLQTASRGGTLSDPVLVRDVSWTATLGGKVIGSIVANPHAYVATRRHDALRTNDPTTSEAWATPVGTVRASAGWQSRSPVATLPPARHNHAAAHDPATGQTVLFGGTGRNAGTFLGDTWVWDGTRWSPSAGVVSPTPRNGHAMAHDTARGRTVLYGGRQLIGLPGDTWEFDGHAWTERQPTGPTPGSQERHTMAYDPVRGVTVLAGGNGDTHETWEWNGDAWTEVVTSTKPPSRVDAAMAWSTADQRIVLFGGLPSQSAGTLRDDTWTYDGLDWTAAEPGPPARRDAVMVDAMDLGVLLIGGHGVSGSLDDVWAWRAHSGWTEDTQSLPDTRASSVAVHEPSTGRVLLMGGTDGTSQPVSCMVIGPRPAWDVRCLESEPGARSRFAQAYDAERHETVLFGGVGDTLLDDTWTWDGTAWTQRAPATSPSPRQYTKAAFDRARGVVVMFGGAHDGTFLDETWEWDGTTWQAQTTPERPPRRIHHGLAYDEAREVMVLFGGERFFTDTTVCDPDIPVCNDTWEYDGVDWVERDPPIRPPQDSARVSLAYDESREVMLMMGGQRRDTWEYDGTTWTQHAPAVSPPYGRSTPGMAYDPYRGGVILFGGFTFDLPGYLDDTWLWDGTTWSEIDTSVQPPPRNENGMTYDAGRDEITVFGGSDGGIRSDTWALPLYKLESVAQRFTVALDAAGAEGAELNRITARWVAGAETRYDEDLAVPGVRLQIWDQGEWQDVALGPQPPSSPETLCWSARRPGASPPPEGCTDTVDGARVDRLFRFGERDEASFAITSQDAGFGGTDTVTSEDVAVTIRYRLPSGP